MFDLVSNLDRCPRDLGKIFDSKKEVEYFFWLVDKHGLQAFLSHFLTCKYCRKLVLRKDRLFIEGLLVLKKIERENHQIQRKRLDTLFKKEGLKGLLFKDLSQMSFYTRTNLFQPARDLDVLMQRHDYEIAKKIIVEDGWMKRKRYADFVRLTNFFWEQELFDNGKGGFVDLQWTPGKYRLIGKPTSSDYESLVGRVFEKQDKGLLIPKKQHQLVLMAVHFCLHDHCFGIRRLFELYHLMKTLKKKEFKEAINLAKDTNCWRTLLYVILVTEKIFKDKVVGDDMEVKIGNFDKLLVEMCKIRSIQAVDWRDNSRKLVLVWSDLIRNIFLSNG